MDSNSFYKRNCSHVFYYMRDNPIFSKFCVVIEVKNTVTLFYYLSRDFLFNIEEVF